MSVPFTNLLSILPAVPFKNWHGFLLITLEVPMVNYWYLGGSVMYRYVIEVALSIGASGLSRKGWEVNVFTQQKLRIN